ncbi:hypothetical protein RP20_CCG010132 [Aedes albopictus]|nr:hypothetical protein RP20_CCG010132 [Aedes albopictus]
MDGNTPSDQDSASGGSAASKKGASPFDNLSRDDLVKKCRGLLGIAQKAKQAKDECLEENRKLKEQLSLAETQKTADKDCLKAMQEMVSSLTEQKLNAAMKVDELEKAVAGLKREVDGAALLRDQLDKLSVENEAFQRQIKRLTDENEELLGDLSSMEAKMKELGDEKKTVEASKVALEQELLKAKNEAALSGKEEKLIRKLKLYKNKVQEISAKVLLLKSDRKILMKTVKDYSEQVPKWQKELLKASDVLFTRIQALERENACLKKANADSLNQKHAQGSEQIMAFEEQLKQVTTEKEALEDSILCKQKVIDDMEAKNSSLNCVVAQMEEKLRLEQTENQKLSEQLVRLSEESTQNQAELRSQLDEVQARLIKQAEELEAKSSQLVDYERKLEREEEENEKSLTEAHQALSKELEQLKDSNDKKSTTISELQTVKESLEARNIDLQEQLQEAEMTRKHLAEMVEQFKIDAAQVQSQHQARLAELQELSAKQCADLEDKVRKDIEGGRNQEELQRSLEEAKRGVSTKEEELQQVQKKLQEYTSALEALQGRYDTLTVQNQQLQASCEVLVDQKTAGQTELRALNDALKAENENLQTRLLEAEETIRTLAAEIEVLKTSVSEAWDQVEAKDVQLSQFEQKLRQEAEENEKGRNAIVDKENTLTQVQQKLQESSNALKTLQERYDALTVQNQELQSSHDEIVNAKATDQSELQEMANSLKSENGELLKRLSEGEETARLMAEEIERLQNRISEAYEQVDAKDAQLSQFEQKLRQEADENEKGRNLITEKENTFQQLQQKLQETVSTLESIQGKHDLLAAENQQLQTVNEKLFDENATFKTDLGTVQSKLELVKLENSDLLSELKEINEILKERGGVISLQLSKISELESQKTTLQQKLTELSSPDVNELKQRSQDLERQLADKETELIALRERDRSFDAQSDVMSTSTISRAEESARMRDVDDSFEEKYNKLRSLAVKLKKKVAEQTLQLQKFEKERETLTTGKNLQSLQAEYDRLLDQMEAERQGTQQREAELKDLKEQLEKQQQEIETLNQVRTELDSSSRKDKSSLETTIREYREQLQNLKREKEAFNLAKKEIDLENQKLKATLKAKEKQLSEELEAQKELKAEVEKCRLAAKKANVLNLEMEAYEKSLAELNKKLEMKKVHEKELEGTIDVQEGTIKSLKSQLTLLEQSMNAERSHSQELKKNVDLQQEKLRVSEHQRGEINVELAQLKVEYERIKLEIESNRVELSEAVTEKEKVNSSMEAEKSKLLKQVYSLECDAEELRIKLKEKTQEVEDVRTEFASYKIRAQSVLRQNQNKENGKERELQEEVQTLQKSLDLSQQKLQTFTQQITEMGKSCDELRDDKTRLQSRCKELHDLLEESRLQNESLMEESRRSNLNHQEALKTQRLQNETLVSCYKKQIEELQEQYSKEVESLQVRITQATARHSADPPNDLRNNNHSIASTSAAGFGFFRGQHISDEQKINLLMMEREEGEGSESTSSNQNPSLPRRKSSNSSQQNQRTRSARDLIPLDELLNSSFDDPSVFEADPGDLRPSTSPTVELQHTKDKLTKQESRVRHLTALLAEAEQDLAKLTQLNELLKEEVRRHERAIEREKHVHNSEYLKNVIFKFLTLNSGDEKSHLVPVLNTILRLSPEETQKLNNVARGTDGGGRGWTGILWN